MNHFCLAYTNTRTNKTKVCTMNANEKCGDKIKSIQGKHLFEVNALLIGVCGNPSDWKPPVWRLSWVGTGVNAKKIKPNGIQDFFTFICWQCESFQAWQVEVVFKKESWSWLTAGSLHPPHNPNHSANEPQQKYVSLLMEDKSLCQKELLGGKVEI